jgi:aminopeptidase N
VGLPVPAFVYPNHQDHAYAKVMLDPVSLAFVRERLEDIEEPFIRQLVWTSLWDMVRDARLRSTEYLALVRRHAPDERDVALLDAVLEQALPVLRRYVPESRMERESAALVALARRVLDEPDRPEDDRRVWLRLAIAAATSATDVGSLEDIVDAGAAAGLPVDQDMRWSVAVKATSLGLPGAADRVDVERSRDRSDRGQREAIRAQVAAPTEAAKTDAWERIHGSGYGSDYLTRAALAGFQWHGQRELLLPWRERYFERVRGIYRERDLGFAQSYLRWLFPGLWGEEEVVARSGELLDELGPSEVQLRRHLLEVRDDLERAIRVRAFAESAPD